MVMNKISLRGMGVMALLLCLATPAMADGPVINVDAGDDPLVIRGTLTGATGSFSGNVRITVTGGGTIDLRLLASDLTHGEDSTYEVDRSNISIPSGTSFTENQPRDVRVTVNNVTRPGVYTGELLFYLAEHENPEEDGHILPLELHIGVAPNVMPVEASRSIQVVRCYTAVDCFIARLLLPASVVDDEWAIQLDNKTVQPVQVTDFAVLMDGDNTHQVLRTTQLNADVPIALPASDVTTIGLEIDRASLPSDRYQGSVRFGLEGADNPVSVTVDLSVRDGPFWPLIVTLLGIIGGRLFRNLESTEGKKRRELMSLYYDRVAEAASVKNPEAATFLKGELDRLRRALDEDPLDISVIEQELTKLKTKIAFLATLENLEEHLTDALRANLEPKIAAARAALLAGQMDEAERLRKEVEAELDVARTDTRMGPGIDRLLDLLRDTSKRLIDEEEDEPPEQPGGARWGWLARFLGWLAGAKAIRNEVEYWLLWPLFSTLLLIALVLVGLKSLYVNAGATFGATGLYDYLGLLLWGFSSTVAQNTLQNLTVPK
jgi:hypothetical protein